MNARAETINLFKIAHIQQSISCKAIFIINNEKIARLRLPRQTAHNRQ